MLRSVVAVVAGFVVITAVVIAFTFALSALLYPGRPMDAPVEPSATWLVLNLVYSLMAALVGGWVAAWIANRSPFAHAVALAVLLAVVTLAGSIGGGEPAAPSGGPAWYPYLVALLGILGVLLGGRLAIPAGKGPGPDR
ncbi:MAG: hypothetical protein R3199_09290 [Gemmatimonadota bacterium]|nr:hypothetical protein [Gemmatimonadota bacterium]